MLLKQVIWNKYVLLQIVTIIPKGEDGFTKSVNVFVFEKLSALCSTKQISMP